MRSAQTSWTDGEVPASLHASQLLEWGVKRLQEAGMETALLDARLLMQHALGLSREDLLREDIAVTDSGVTLYDALIARRMKYEPVAKIIGKRGFWKHEFLVNASTLDPRPDSETLVQAVLFHRTQPMRRVLDLGTGTGCLLLSLLHEYPEAQGVGVDISEQALALARENARILGLESRVNFRISDWCAQVDGAFDVIVCNPPYIAECEADALMPEVRKYDPFIALFGGRDGLDAYRALLPQVVRHLAADGIAVLELGAGLADAVAQLAAEAGLKEVARCPDLAGITRALVCRVS